MNKFVISLMLSTLIAPQCLASDTPSESQERESKPIVFKASVVDKEQDELEPPMQVEREIQHIVSDPASYKTEGSFFGFGGTTTLSPEALAQLVGEAIKPLKTSVEDGKALARALREAQERADLEREKFEKLKRKAEKIKAKKKIQKALYEQTEKKWKKTLTALNDKDGVVELQKEREAELLKTIAEKDKIIAKLQEQSRSLENLKEEKQKLKELLKTSGQDLLESVRKAIEGKEAKIKVLEGKVASYEKEKRTKEEDIEKLRKSIKGHDYPGQIAEMIKDVSVSDEQLSLKMFAIMNFLGMDLDQLSEGLETSLPQMIMDVSIPYGPKPWDANPAYDGSWRGLGNKFLPEGERLVWKGGRPVENVRYQGSSFGRNSGAMKQAVVEALTKKK